MAHWLQSRTLVCAKDDGLAIGPNAEQMSRRLHQLHGVVFHIYLPDAPVRPTEEQLWVAQGESSDARHIAYRSNQLMRGRVPDLQRAVDAVGGDVATVREKYCRIDDVGMPLQ